MSRFTSLSVKVGLLSFESLIKINKSILPSCIPSDNISESVTFDKVSLSIWPAAVIKPVVELI